MAWSNVRRHRQTLGQNRAPARRRRTATTHGRHGSHPTRGLPQQFKGKSLAGRFPGCTVDRPYSKTGRSATGISNWSWHIWRNTVPCAMRTAKPRFGVQSPPLRGAANHGKHIMCARSRGSRMVFTTPKGANYAVRSRKNSPATGS